MLTSKQRAILRGKANTMDPVYIVGKGEIDETLIQGVKDCLDARELIKLKVLENSMYNAREAATKLAEATGADCVQVIGSKFVLYLQKKKDAKATALDPGSGYFLFGHEHGLRHPASASCLGRHLRLAGRCPNSNSLFPPLAAVVAVASHSIARPIALRATGSHPSGRSSEKIPAACNAASGSAGALYRRGRGHRRPAALHPRGLCGRAAPPGMEALRRRGK